MFHSVGVKHTFCALVAVLILFTAGQAGAAVYDPSANWKTIETKHFRVHFPKRIEKVAQRATKILEDVHPDITAKWNWKPWSYTEVVLNDNTDESNGLSSVLPYNWMLIFVAPPSPDSSLAHYDDWLRMLLIHEYTHIVQMDAYGGVWIPIRVLLGKTVAPSGINPTWIREGVAQYDETFFTGGGRGRGSYSEMIVRTAILTGTFPPIDLADGLSWRWPGYKAAYVYGLKFIQWLIEVYGEEKFLKFDRRVRSSVMLTMINHQARNVYGKTFYELWNEWKRALEERYAKERAEIEANGVTKTEPIVSIKHDEQYYSPAISYDGKRLVYTAASPHGRAEIRVKDLTSGETKVVKKGQDAVQFSWNREDTKLVYSAIGSVKRFYRYNDIWLHDFEAKDGKGKTKQLTKGMRARDPDFDPSGKSIVMVVNDKGTDELKVMDIETKEVKSLTPDVPSYTQFANPRFSADGKHIAVSVWKPGAGWRVHRCDSDGKNFLRLTDGKGLAIEARPVWSPDGKNVVFASDESGIGNLYKVSAKGGTPMRITNVLTGVFQPTIAGDGEVIAQNFTDKGFEIAKFDVRLLADKKSGKGGHKAKDEKSSIKVPSPLVGPLRQSFSEAREGKGEGDELTGPFAVVGEEETTGDFKSRKYVAFGKSLFLPRYIVPGAAYVGDAFFASLFTGGADPLWWNTWTGGATYRTDANYFGYSFQYTYNRFIPVFGVLTTAYAVDFGSFPDIVAKDANYYYSSGTFRLFERRRAVAAYAAYSYKRNVFNVAYVFENHESLHSITDLNKEYWDFNFGNFGGFRVEYRYGDAEKFPASISQENGRNIRLTTNITDRALGSGVRNEQVIFSGDWREYINLGHHNVMAIRAGGGMTWGDRLVQGTFGLGGALGEGSFGGAGSFNYFPLRGLPVSAFSGTRAMLFSSEYRFPIRDVLRGIGTVPFFVKDISGALFSDFGNCWNAGDPGSDSFEDFFDRFMLSVGTELRGNFIVGHGMLIHGRIGYGIVVWHRNRIAGFTDPILGDSVKNGMLVLALGTAF